MSATTTSVSNEYDQELQRLRVFARALTVCLGAAFVGVLFLFPTRILYTLLRFSGTTFGQAIRGNFIQVGFAVFAAAYLFRSENPSQYLNIRVPTGEDVAWIVTLPISMVLVGRGYNWLLIQIGFPRRLFVHEPIEFVIYEHPFIFPAVFIALFVFAAPAEELVYRGIIHGELRRAYRPVTRIIIAAFLFGLLHVLMGILTPGGGLLQTLHWGISALLPGVLWGLAYERTDNLIVTASVHAISWTVPVSTLLPV